MRTHTARAVLAAALALLTAACASASKRYEQGIQLEEQGRPAEAAARYVSALRGDPSLADARARLADAGARALADYQSQADAADAVGRSDQAADVLLRADDLLQDAAAVGVQLATPPDYAARRRATFDRAVELSLRQADVSAGRGEFANALQWLERASDRWHPGATQRGEIDRARFGVQLRWAEADLAAGRFRSAYDRAEQAARLPGADVGRLRSLRDEALRLGTVRAAVLPVGATSPVRRQTPEELRDRLNDALDEEHWSRPAPFLELADLTRVGREVRRLGYEGQALSAREASEVGRALGVEVVVAAALDSVTREESDVRSTRRPARTIAGADTAYAIREGRRTLWGRVKYTLVDVDDRRVLREGFVTGRGSARFREARYEGRWQGLVLTREERDLFQSDNRGVESELARALADALSDDLGREILAELQRLVD